MSTHRRISHLAGCSAIAVSALLAAACSSGGGTSSSQSSPPAVPAGPPQATAAVPASESPSAAPGGAGGQAAGQITKNWQAFFSASTPVSQRVGLLQDGSQFQQVISSQSGSGLAKQASAKVTKVTVTSPTQANVTYNVLLGGKTVLPNSKGTAVLENGTWKVGVQSFCGLLTLENGGSSAGLPAGCASQ